MSKKKGGEGEKERKKEGGKQKTKQNKNKTKTKKKKKNKQKAHRPYSSLDLTDPNFAFGGIFFTILLESLKKSAVLILSKIFWFGLNFCEHNLKVTILFTIHNNGGWLHIPWDPREYSKGRPISPSPCDLQQNTES